MRDGLIRIEEEKDLFYDSIDRLYRVRMSCPYCGKYSGCRCFPTLEKAEIFIVDGTDFTCSSKCSINCLADDQGRTEVADNMKEMGFQTWGGFFNASLREKLTGNNLAWRIKAFFFEKFGWLSEKEAWEVYCFNDPDFDSVEGESC